MEKGFNSDIYYKGEKFHIQTEDWGDTNPCVVTKIFRNGAVIKTIKTPYASAQQKTAVRMTLKYQHTQVLDLLLSGQL